MQIQSIIKRPGGSHVDMPGAKYHFQPNELDHHVAEVVEPTHIARLLSISEGFRVYDPATAEEAPPVLQPFVPAAVMADANAPAGAVAGFTLSLEHPDAFVIKEKTVSQVDVIARIVKTKLGDSVNDWEDLSDGARADLIDEELDLMANEEEPAAAEDQSNVAQATTDAADPTEERIALVEAYVAKFGEKPHHFLSAAKIRAKLEEA